MSYGKYAPQQSFISSLKNDYMELGYQDPWFLLGHMLGATYANNYNERGDKKILDAAGKELSFGGNSDTSTPDSIDNRMAALDNITMQGTGPSISVSGDNYAQNAGMAQQRQTATPTISASGGGDSTLANMPQIQATNGAPQVSIRGDNTTPSIEDVDSRMKILNQLQAAYGAPEQVATSQSDYNGGNAVPSAFELRRNSELQELNKLRERQAVANQQGQELPEYQQGQSLVVQPIDNTQAIRATGRNVSGLSQETINSLASQAPKGIIDFDKTSWLANKRADLLKQGYSGNRLDSMIAQLDAMATAYDTKVKNNNTQFIVNSLLQKNDKGQYTNYDITSPEFQAKIIELAKYSPEAANVFAKNIVNSNQQWINNQGIDKERRNFGYQQAAADNQLKRTEGLYGFKNSIDRDNFIWKSGVKRQADIQNLLDKAELYRKLRPDASDEDIANAVFGGSKSRTANVGNNKNAITTDDIQKWRQAAIAYGYSTDGGYEATPDKTSRGNLINGMRRMTNAGMSKQQIAQYFGSFDNHLSTEEIDKMLNEVDSITGGFENNDSNNAQENPSQQRPAYDLNNPADKNNARTNWNAALQRNAGSGDSMWTKEQMIQEARKRYGDYADELINNTNWSDYGL